jgi:hypothetical protein
LAREARAEIVRFGDKRCQAFRELIELLELAEMPLEEMGSA